MRSIDKSARVAVAILYVRLRDARRQTTTAIRTSGPDSRRSAAAMAREIELSNSLKVVQGALCNGLPGHGTPHDFIRNVRMSAAMRARMRANEAIAA